MIFENLLCIPEGVLMNMQRKSCNFSRHYDYRNCTHSDTHHFTFPDILRTCKEIYEECIPILYGKNHFYLLSNWDVRQIKIPRTVFPGVSTTNFLRRIDLHISIGRDDTLNTMQCIRQIAADVQGIVTLKIRLLSSKRPQRFHPLMAAVVEAMKSLVALTHVKLNVENLNTEWGNYWPSSHTRDLESSLGPSLSEGTDELYFRPSRRPRDWGKLNVSPLLRLPINVREKIFFLVIGRVHDEEEEVNNPSRTGNHRLATKRIALNVQNHIVFTGRHQVTSTTQTRSCPLAHTASC